MRINNTINKEFILRNISQVKIFVKYTNIAEGIIEDCINNNTLIQSPFRMDSNPSTGFRYDRSNKLKMKVVELPVSATEDRVVGTLDIEHAIKYGEKKTNFAILSHKITNNK